jgi:DNA-binding MarR family transcriptional regulator
MIDRSDVCYHLAMSRVATAADGADASRRSDTDLFDDFSFLLARANALSLAAGNVALREHGLRVRSYSVLALTASRLQPTQRELAELLRLDPSQVVALVDDLQSRGLVTRHPDPNDRRVNVVVATDEGRTAYARAASAVADAQQALLEGFSVSERDQLAALLHRLAFPGTTQI